MAAPHPLFRGAQIASNTFDLDANLALLRFYQFQPTAVKPALLAKVLLKALMQLPGQDFKVCVHLVPERLQADGPVAQALNLAGLVETTEFGKFWAACAGEAKDLVASGE